VSFGGVGFGGVGAVGCGSSDVAVAGVGSGVGFDGAGV